MNMVALMQLLSRLAKRHTKRVMTLSELARYTQEPAAAIGMALHRAQAKGLVDHVATLWINAMDPPPLEEVALAIPIPSYVSFESALYETGMLSQSPRGFLSMATTSRPRTLRCCLGTIRFHHLKQDLFFGFDAARRAHPEKAWLDLLYLRMRSGTALSETFYPESLRPKRLRQYARAFPAAVRRRASAG